MNSASTRGCVECNDLVLGLERCDGCKSSMHAECGRYRVVGARFLCSVCDDDEPDADEPPFADDDEGMIDAR